MNRFINSSRLPILICVVSFIAGLLVSAGYQTVETQLPQSVASPPQITVNWNFSAAQPQSIVDWSIYTDNAYRYQTLVKTLLIDYSPITQTNQADLIVIGGYLPFATAAGFDEFGIDQILFCSDRARPILGKRVEGLTCNNLSHQPAEQGNAQFQQVDPATDTIHFIYLTGQAGSLPQINITVARVDVQTRAQIDEIIARRNWHNLVPTENGDPLWLKKLMNVVD